MNMCEYGCGQEAKYQLKNGKWCCESSWNKCLVIKNKNSEALKNTYKNGRKTPISCIKQYNCPFCNLIVNSFNIERHKQVCEKNPEVIKKLEEQKNNLDHTCEKCGKKHNGLFATGRFCGIHCANSKIMSEETKLKISSTFSSKPKKPVKPKIKEAKERKKRIKKEKNTLYYYL